jgi:hypothetical protein
MKHSASGDHYFEYDQFSFVPFLQQWALEETERFMGNSSDKPFNFTRLYWRHEIDSVVRRLDEELIAKGLPHVEFIHLFRRPPFFTSAIHYDTYNVTNYGPTKFNGIFHRKTAFNIPVEGCDDESFFNFYQMHTPEKMELIDSVDHNGNRYAKTHITWDEDPNKPPTLLEQAHMKNPMFVRSGLPHQGVTGSVSKIHLSMRFIKNEPLEFFKSRLLV